MAHIQFHTELAEESRSDDGLLACHLQRCLKERWKYAAAQGEGYIAQAHWDLEYICLECAQSWIEVFLAPDRLQPIYQATNQVG